MNWQVVSLIEALGVLRSRIAQLYQERERERRDFAQKLEAAKDALACHEQSEHAWQDEVERLERELATALQERNEARWLVQVANEAPGTSRETAAVEQLRGELAAARGDRDKARELLDTLTSSAPAAALPPVESGEEGETQ